ncbi:hypothetical protein F4677DRAFT_10265 [Hypoxylon crocopeplum]|nr:hypothetical protein F4677DRAFT_10265 [Hypoxylon crocopeplum]
MVGIPKSNRCEFCRWRKTKCDEAWPTCGGCRKAGKKCSGPSRRVKFVHNGRHIREDKQKSDLFPGIPDISLADEVSHASSTMSLLHLKNRTTTNGSTFSKLRMCTVKPSIPKKLAGSHSDLLAGKVMTYLKSSEGTGYSLGMFLSTLGFVPSMLDHNEALFDATNLLLSTWLKFCQGTDPEDMFDLRSYGRALRSLQKVLNDPKEQKSSSTLAAAIYLQTTEYLFDCTRGINQVSHSNGIYTIMMNRGPPKPGDNFGCQLIFDSFVFMFRLLLAGNIDNFFIRPEWQGALTRFFSQFKHRAPAIMEMSKLVQYATLVADAVKRLSNIRNVPSDLRDVQGLEEFAADLEDIAIKYRALDASTIQPLLQNRKIYEEEDPISPVGTSYQFPNGITALYFANLTSFNIVINRLRQELNIILGLDNPSIEAECLEFSGRIWRTCRYSQSLKPLCVVSFNTPMCMSYVAAGPSVRAYLLDFLRDTDSYRKSNVRRWTEEAVLTQYNILVGRVDVDGLLEMPSLMRQFPRV